MVLPTGIVPYSPPTPYSNQSGRGFVVALTRVGATASGLGTPPVILRALPGDNSINPQYPPP